MAKLSSVSVGVVLTDGGATVIDQVYGLSDLEIDDYRVHSLRLAPSGALEIDLAADISGLTDWVRIVGVIINVKGPGAVDVLLTKAGTESFQVSAAPFYLGRTELDYIKVTNGSGVSVDGVMILIGERS